MKSSNKKQFKLSELTQDLDVEIQGDPDCVISGIATLEQSQTGDITFLTNPIYRKYLATTKASAVVLSAEFAIACKTNVVLSRNPKYVYSKIADFFLDPITITPGIHESVMLGKDTCIHPSACIGAHCTLADRVKIGANVVLGSGCFIGSDSEIGDATLINANVTIYHGVKIGKQVKIASGAVIGSDGFGFTLHAGQWYKVPQLGGVIIHDDVDIGANTTIDRGAVDDTVLGKGVKLDNLIQVGHNVKIGENTIIAGCVAIAGSTEIGKNCMIGGGTCFAGHMTIGDNTLITGMTAVTKSITEPGTYSSGIVGAVPNLTFRKNNARFHRLDQLMQRVKTLEIAMKKHREK